MEREDIRFRSGDAECAGWLLRPGDAAGEVPCVVLGHGFGAVKEARLSAYAERFCAAGYAALAFDPRHFGESGGEPRQLLDIGRQQADWRAAIAYARALASIDPKRIALWGSSLGGGHVIAVSAGDPRLAAVISQAPHVDGLATLWAAGPANIARLLVAGLRDILRVLRRRPPYLVPIVAAPGELAAMNSPDAFPGYSALFEPGVEWRNEVAARIFLSFAFPSPGRRARRVAAPLLVQAASEDVVTPPEPARRVARRAPRGELREYRCGHFDVYAGDVFERVVADQLAFLARHLNPS